METHAAPREVREGREARGPPPGRAAVSRSGAPMADLGPGSPGPSTATPSSSRSPRHSLAAPLTALTLLHSCSLSRSELDAVRCYQPWCGVRAAGSVDGDLADDRAPSAIYSTALCGLAGRIEDAFSPVPMPLPLAGAPTMAPTARRRSEKKATPEEQKDQRYLERRRRNNHAAKKSRDARRAREDQVALRAALLEHENAVLRAQVLALREEVHSLRRLLLHGKTLPGLHGLHGLHGLPPAPLGDMPRI